jgi:hypothetical protein
MKFNKQAKYFLVNLCVLSIPSRCQPEFIEGGQLSGDFFIPL